MFVASKSRFILRSVVVLLGLFSSPIATAQSTSGYSPNPNLYDLSNRASEIGWLRGESYDTRSGQMNHVMNDVVLNGTGLPIVVTRGIYQGDKRGINLIFPKLKLLNKALNGAPPECNQAHARSITFTDASTSESFVSSAALSNEIKHIPSYATHASKNNWIVKCDGATYVAQAPTGVEYHFGYSLGFDPDLPTSSVLGGYWDVLHVTKMQDNHGNTLTFGYEGYRAPYDAGGSDNEWRNGEIVGVSSIVASDGRELLIDYVDVDDSSLWTYLNSSVNKKRVSRVYTPTTIENNIDVRYNKITNGYEVDHGLGKKYRYTFNYVKSDKNILARIDYPTGGSVSYSYPSNALPIISSKNDGNLNKHLPLESRTTSGPNVVSGTWQFEGLDTLNDRRFARIIHTPSNTIEYRYRKTGWEEYYLDSGMVLEQKVFLDNQFNWNEYSTPLVTVKNDYHVVYDMYNGAEVTAYRNVKISEKITRLFGVQEGNASVIKTGPYLTFTTTYNYDNANFANPERLLRSVTETSPSHASDRITSFTYENSSSRYIVGLPVREETNSGDLTTRLYNPDGTVKERVVNGVKTAFTYFQGNLITTTTSGKTHTTLNYERGIPTREEDAEGRVITRVVNPNGTVASETVLGGSDTYTYEYDALQRLTRTTYPGLIKSPSVIEYPSHRKSIERMEGGSSYISTELDGFGRTILIDSLNSEPNTPSDRRITATYYDAEGQIVKVTYPTDQPLSYNGLAQLPSLQTIYDGAGRKIRTEETINSNTGEKRIRHWTRTISNNRETLKYKNGRNVVQNSYYDSFGSPKQEFLQSMTDGNGVTTLYDRDAQGRLNSMSRDGQVRSYFYNPNKQLRAETHPESGETSYQYYDDGLLRTRSNNGRVATYTYKTDNQIDEIRWNDGRAGVTIRHYYNNRGLLQSAERNAADSAFTVYSAYGYDALGRLTYEKNTDNSGTSLQMTYQYDFVGNLSRITYPNERTYELSPNFFGQNTIIREPGGKEVLSGVTYYPNGAYSTIASGSNVLRSERNDRFQVSGRRHELGGTTAVHQTYAYDPESNMSYLRDEISGKSQSMSYDNVGRLKTVSGTRLGSRNFEYNNKDDIILKKVNGFEETYIYNWKGHLTEITSANPTRGLNYNVHGEVINMHISPSPESTNLNYMELTRDPEGRLVETSEGTKYGYDHRGLRFITEDGGRTYTYYDLSGKLRYRWDQMANVESEYHYVGDELIAKREVYLTAGSEQNPPSDGGGSVGDNVEDQFGYTVNHDTFTISWTSSHWHQVQKADGTSIGCDGGSSCTVPEPGDYVAISFGSEVERTPISVRGSSSTGDNWSDNTANGGGDNTSSGGEAGDGYTVNNETLTISWTSTNWHQVQRSDGSSIGCDGGQSCTVPVPGDYIAISFGDSVIRTAVRVDGQAAFGDDTGGSSDSGGSSGSGSSNGDASTPVGEQQGDYYVDHAAQVIRWTVAGWHQVQMSDGTNIGCDGGNACSVPGTGNYVGINHDTGYRTPLVVRSESNQNDDSQSVSNDAGNSTSSEGEQQGNYTVDHAALIIRWSTAGWHQIQKSDGTNIGCDGGNSCTVPSAGDYIGINHTSGLRTSLTVNGGSSNTTNEPSDSNDSADGGNTASTTEQDGDYTINHSARTISWSVSGWHQVQTSNGGDIGCNGGTSCTVPTDGNYIVINHGTGQRKTVTVGSASSVSINGDYTIDLSTKTISWTVSGWHQVQRSNGEDIGCNGGYSCTVPESGSYIAINHGTGSRTPLSVN